MRRRQEKDELHADGETEDCHRGQNRGRRLRGQQTKACERRHQERWSHPQPSFLERDECCERKEYAEGCVEAELVLRCKGADETVGAVKRVVVVATEKHGKDENEDHPGDAAEYQRAQVDASHGNQGAQDMRQVLHAGAGGWTRCCRPEDGQEGDGREGEYPEVPRGVAQHLAIIDQQQRQPERVVKQDGRLAEAGRIGKDKKRQRHRRDGEGQVLPRCDQTSFREPHGRPTG